MKTVAVALTIRVVMEIPDTMTPDEAVSEIDYSFIGDEDNLIAIKETEIVDVEEMRTIG